MPAALVPSNWGRPHVASRRDLSRRKKDHGKNLIGLDREGCYPGAIRGFQKPLNEQIIIMLFSQALSY